MAMARQSGTPDRHLWLLGDSEPPNWRDLLLEPFDSRHPVRHQIWTSILDVVQELVFVGFGLRVANSALYVRNAIDDPSLRPPASHTSWPDRVAAEVSAFRTLLEDNQPPIVLTFGAFAFEFARRALDEKNPRPFGEWRTDDLGREFRRRLLAFLPAIQTQSRCSTEASLAATSSRVTPASARPRARTTSSRWAPSSARFYCATGGFFGSGNVGDRGPLPVRLVWRPIQRCRERHHPRAGTP